MTVLKRGSEEERAALKEVATSLHALLADSNLDTLACIRLCITARGLIMQESGCTLPEALGLLAESWGDVA